MAGVETGQDQRVILGAAVGLMAAVALLSGLQLFWLSSYFDDDQFGWGYFEIHGKGAELVVDGLKGRSDSLDVALETANLLRLSPGKSLVFPLARRGDLTITAGVPGLAPYVVVGSLVRTPEAADLDASGVRVLAEAKRLSWTDGRLSWSDWNPALPWQHDAELLRTVAAACGSSEKAEPIRVVADGRAMRLDYGSCHVGLQLPDSSTAALALVPGPETLAAESTTPWQTHRQVRGHWLVVVVLLVLAVVLVLCLLLEPTPCLLLCLVPGLLAPWSPMAGVVTSIVIVLMTLALIGWQLVRQRRRLARTSSVAAVIVAVAGLLVVFLGVAGRFAEPMEWPQDRIGDHEGSVAVPGVLMGYSTVAGGALRPGTDGILEHFRRLARPHVDPLSRRAFAGQTFARISDAICGELETLPEGTRLFFFGGSNDDIFSGIQADVWRHIRVFWGRLNFISDRRRWRKGPESFAEGFRRSYEAQTYRERLLAAALTCANERRYPFFYFHDFMAIDLGGIAADVRWQMREARRVVVTAAGGHFVDLWGEVRREVGVAWFNDVIHLSNFGARQMAETMARHLDDP